MNQRKKSQRKKSQRKKVKKKNVKKKNVKRKNVVKKIFQDSMDFMDLDQDAMHLVKCLKDIIIKKNVNVNVGK